MKNRGYFLRMAAVCKHQEENMEKKKCSDYFIFWSKNPCRHYCRLTEWKTKKGVCPYDKNIVSKFYKDRQKGNKKLGEENVDY
jgi:hypothetical protein